MALKHRDYMEQALKEAQKALAAGEVPIGAVVVNGGKIIGRGHNLVETRQDATAHAEMIALQEASRSQKDWRLSESTLYVTLEPCAMCSGALVRTRIKRLVFGARDWEQGGSLSNFKITNFEKHLHKIEVIEGILEAQCQEILEGFFDKVRNLRNKD